MKTEAFIQATEGAAIEEALRSGVPASITEAQAIIESGSGNSRLFQEGKNLFGIKCHSDWYGEHIYADDDAPNECFRKYDSVRESFRDHSEFLKDNSRYKKLFSLAPDDYVSWAKGLQGVGYATSKNYANALVNIIRKYNLDDLDRRVKIRRTTRTILLVTAAVIIVIALILIFRKYGFKQFNNITALPI